MFVVAMSVFQRNALFWICALTSLMPSMSPHVPTPDTRTPWRSMLRVMGSERFPDQVFRSRSVAWARSVGAFDQSAYERSRVAPRMLADTVHDLAAKGSRVVVVLTPEYSLLRFARAEGDRRHMFEVGSETRVVPQFGGPRLSRRDYGRRLHGSSPFKL